MSMFHDDATGVVVLEGSDYYLSLCGGGPENGGECEVPVHEYVGAFFGGRYQRDHIMRNAIILGGILAFVRLSTFLALRYFTYSGK